MKKKTEVMCFLSVLTLAGFALNSCSHNTIQVASATGDIVEGSGKEATDVRYPGNKFSRVSSQIAADLNITCSGKDSLKVTADSNLLPLIETTVQGDTLKISAKKSFKTKNRIFIEMNPATLKSFRLSGSGNTDISEIKGDQLDLELSGSGNLNARGKVEKVFVDVSGSGNWDLEHLEANDAKIKVSGSGNVSVFCRKSLDCYISGSADVRYLGNPTSVTKDVSGSGRVRKL